MEDKKMKKILSNIFMTAALLVAGAAVVSCEKENLPVEGTFTMTVDASMANIGSKNLTLDGTGLHATWAVGEKVTVYNNTQGAALEGYLEAQSAGASTTLKGDITGNIAVGDELKLEFCNGNYSSQTGTLEYIAANCDYAVATVTVSAIGSGSTKNITTTGHANFVNQQAIVKFTLKNKADASALSVDKLFVTAGGTTCEVTPSGATSELYVAVPAIASGRVTLTALSGSTYYDYLKTGVTLAQSQYYTISASLTEVKSISNAREASLGRVVAADRMMYASVESATNAGTTALAVIARMHAGIVHNDFTAIAVSDESSKMNWNNANNACNNKTPIGGATWQLPSVSLWEDMFWFNGGDEYNYTGLDALITKAGGTALDTEWYYWTSTDGTYNSDYKRNMLLRDSDGTVVFNNGSDKSSLLLVRAFLTFQGDYSLL